MVKRGNPTPLPLSATAGLQGEDAEQAALFDWIRLQQAALPALKLAFAIPNGGKRPPRTAARMKRTGQRAGVLDVCLPVARHGYIGLWIEMKYGNNKLSPEQHEFALLLIDEGHYVAVCYDWEVAKDTMLRYLGPGRGIPARPH